jgi:methylated-DNA-protein-cysteine methyltransferase related protein
MRRHAGLRPAPPVDASARDRILAAVRRIPHGRVSTYGWIARVAGMEGRARLVGTALRDAPDDPGVPWHRVVNAGGRSSLPAGSPGAIEQRRRLEAEGVRYTRDRIALDRYGWPERMVDLDELLWRPPGAG